MEGIIDMFCPNCGQKVELHGEFSETYAKGECRCCKTEIIRTDRNKNVYQQITLVLRKKITYRSNIYD